MSPRLRLILAFVACLVALPCLGGVGGVGVYSLMQSGSLARWRALPAPPQPAAELVTADLDMVVARAVDGQLYQCAHRGPENRPPCWTPLSQPPPPDDDVTFDDPNYEAPRPPGTATDTLVATIYYADAVYEAHYAILGDGRVWVWEHGMGAYLALGQLIFFPLLCAGLAAVVGLALFIFLFVRWRRVRA